MTRRSRGKRRKQEPIWPLMVVLGLAGAGVGVGMLLLDEPTMALPAESIRATPDELPPILRGRVRVEVLNGGGIPGVAGAARDQLRDAGFDVVHFGNASGFGRDTSMVLVRTETRAAALQVARSLGIAKIEVAPDSLAFADLTVVLGTDWSATERVSVTDSVAGNGARAAQSTDSWWDLRRYFKND